MKYQNKQLQLRRQQGRYDNKGNLKKFFQLTQKMEEKRKSRINR